MIGQTTASRYVHFASPVVVSLCYILLSSAVNASDEVQDLTLWYTQPAKVWSKEALPIGNGNLGAMIFGGVSKERIQFNEDSLWIGDETDTGAYQAFGDVYVEMDHPNPQQYRRELDISRAVHTITYESNGVAYKREYFSSYPAGVMVFHFTANKKGAYTATVSLTDMHGASITAVGNRLTASKGSLAKYVYRKSDPKGYSIFLDYESQLLVLNEGGASRHRSRQDQAGGRRRIHDPRLRRHQLPQPAGQGLEGGTSAQAYHGDTRCGGKKEV